MEKQIFQVMDFHLAFNHPVEYAPKLIPVDRALMRHNILNEEVVELLDASIKGNLVECADAICDCIYILLGTAHELGIADKIPACFDEVQRSNMSKLGKNGKPIFREDGKVEKGPNYEKPNLKDIVYGK